MRLTRIQEQLNRVEAKLDALLEALAEESDEQEETVFDLDGELVGGERDSLSPL